jgi:uncharacterized protein YecT (DUF1311 family)
VQANLARDLLLAAMLSMAPSLARADDVDLFRCLNAPTGSEQKQCTQALFQSAAEEMKQVHARVIERAAEADARNASSGDGGAATAIAASQRAWEIYRDAECRDVVGRSGGSGRMVWVFGCLTEKTRARIRELNTPFDQR